MVSEYSDFSLDSDVQPDDEVVFQDLSSDTDSLKDYRVFKNPMDEDHVKELDEFLDKEF